MSLAAPARRASLLFQEKVATELKKAGFHRFVGCGQLFYSKVLDALAKN